MRIRILGIIVFILFLMISLGLFYLQIVRGPFYQRLSAQNRIRLVSLEAPRGRIFDRNGVLLVDNRISFDVAVIPQELRNNKQKDQAITALSEKLGMSREKLKGALKKNFVTPFMPVTVVADIDKAKAIMLEEKRADLPGVVVEARPRRHYIYESRAAHLLGYIGKISADEYARLKGYGYSMNDIVGKSGIEKHYNNYLSGSRGGRQIEVDNMGYQVNTLGIKEPSKGMDLYLTIDIRLQEFIEKIFEGARGAACVLDPRDGQVLALVSAPSFDPNLFIKEGASSEIRRLFAREDYPMLNRAVSCAYPPGSVFKIVTASAALDRGKITPATVFSCAGSYSLGRSVFDCWKDTGHGEQGISDAIKNSCNVFFYQAGRKAGVDDLADYSQRFGLGKPTGIDLSDEAVGVVPGRTWKALKKREIWYEGETVNYAIGQGYLLVTPIQVLGMAASVANGGNLVRPYLVKSIEDVEASHGENKPINVSESTLKVVKEGMVKVVNDTDGTGRKAVVEGVVIGGKTGTAQTSTERTHAWFAGFAPADEPKAAVLVFLEYGGKGGLAASKAAGNIFAKLKELGYL